MVYKSSPRLKKELFWCFCVSFSPARNWRDPFGFIITIIAALILHVCFCGIMWFREVVKVLLKEFVALNRYAFWSYCALLFEVTMFFGIGDTGVHRLYSFFPKQSFAGRKWWYIPWKYQLCDSICVNYQHILICYGTCGYKGNFSILSTCFSMERKLSCILQCLLSKFGKSGRKNVEYWECSRMSSWDLSQLFYNDLGTGNWLTSFQFSRRARRKTLVTTDLSISLQGLAKLWRVLQWESLTNTWKTAQSRVTANTCLQGKVLFNKLMAFYGKVTHSADRRELVHIIILDFLKAFNMVSHSILLEKMSDMQLDE